MEVKNIRFGRDINLFDENIKFNDYAEIEFCASLDGTGMLNGSIKIDKKDYLANATNIESYLASKISGHLFSKQ
jgi:hypothetical protein